MRKILLFIVTLLFIATLFSSVGAANETASPSAQAPAAKLASQMQAELAVLHPGEMMTVIVTLTDQEDMRAIPGSGQVARQTAVLNALRNKANNSQKGLIALLNSRRSQGTVSRFESFWIFNGFSVTATADVINELAARSDVQSITTDDISIVPVSNAAYNVAEANLAVINAPALLNLGFAGQGVVIASMDSGVDVSHPDLASSWRGGSNSWFDPYNEHPTTPTDLTGHGTQTMGVMVGGDSGGSLIGTAPQAQWISVKIFNDSGTATATAIHQGFQWLLDPDGDPNTADAPQVVNNSWAYGFPGCNLEFQPDVQALEAVGILPVFSAGNYGPGASTSVSPANYPESFAVGATDNNDQMYVFSGRGPSACGEASTTYPELMAPGVAINTTDRFGRYFQATGTSLAAPHVSGALALLLSAFPGLTAEQQRLALVNTAVDLGDPGPDNNFGYGRLDVLAAYDLLAAGGVPTPTAVPPTNTPTPTATATAVPPTATPTATAVPSNLIFSDGFESGNLSAWTEVVDQENDLAVTSGAALVGSNGLAALIDNQTAMYLRDDSPLNESGYRVKFSFDPNSISMNNNNSHRILAALDNTLSEVIRLDFRYASGVYQLQASLCSDASSFSTTSWITISDAAHAIEFEWQAATDVGANDGYLSLWIDDLLQETISAIDNDSIRIEEVRLGPLSGIGRATGGTELFDEFVSQRIGGVTLPPTATPVPPTATASATAVPPTATATPLPPTATASTTAVPPTATATPLPPTATASTTAVPPTATATPLPPTATATATAVPPTATATSLPPTATASATAVPSTATSVPPTVTPSPTATAVPSDLIFSDGFESGDFSAWTAVVDQENDLAVTSEAALVGSQGFAALIDNRTAMYLRDDSPLNEARYRVRFYFDPNSITMGNARSQRILAALSSNAEVIGLDFRYAGGSYQVQASLRTDSGSYVKTGWYNISDAAHAIEFDWQAATSAGANNGYLSLWVDGVLQETRSGLDNDTLRIEAVQLGPLSGITNGTFGTELFDDFVSRRTNPIGP